MPDARAWWWGQTRHVVPPRLHLAGSHLETDDGTPVVIRSQSFFTGLLQHLNGDDVRPAMRYARDVAGSICLRTFVALAKIADLNPHRPDFWDGAASYLGLAASEGLYVDYAAGDLQILMPDLPEQMRFFHRLGNLAANHPNLWLISPNEPYKNGIDPFNSLDLVTGPVLRSRGSSAQEEAPYTRLDIYTQHTDRTMVDGAGHLLEDGYRWVRHQYEQHALGGLQYHEEPMGCADHIQGNRRDNDPARFAQASLVGEVSGLGWCFHSEYGMAAGRPAPGSAQDQCAQAVGAARRWMRPEAQTWHITRSGLADAALVLDDAHALRVYMRLGSREGQAVAVRPRDYHPVAQNGWRVVRQSPDGSMIDVAR
jgi:hypothetical protein